MNKKIIGLSILMASALFFGSCKPKQSAYKQIYEAAKQREMEENQQSAVEVDNSDSSTTPVYEQEHTTESVRKEKITPVTDADAASLKTYNVVIAVMGMKPNADSLKERIEAAGYPTILVRNEVGMFRVIIASSNTKEEAIATKDQILSSFYAQNDTNSLRAKYGIPFNDWWILQRMY